MTLFDSIEYNAINNPENIALMDEKLTISYKQLYEHLRNNQAILNTNGYGEGMKVILQSENQLNFALAFLCLLSVECWIIPVSGDITQAELKRVISLTGATVLSCEMLGVLKSVGSNCNNSFKKPRESKTGIYHLSSGTTGMPKLCIRTLECLVAEGTSFNKTFQIKKEDKILSVSPLYHSYALGAALMATMVSGNCLFTLDRFVPRKVLRIIHENKISILILVPAMARLICNTSTPEKYDLSSLRVCLVGAGPINEEVYNKFKDRFGVVLLSNYGSTETGALVSRLVPLPYTSIGKPMYGVEIKICNDEGEKVATGEEGELRVRCRGMLKGYAGSETLLLDDEGFFSMGDIAVQDAQGYLYIKGRKKLMINVGGKKVNPYEVEAILLGFHGVKECAVVGLKRENGDEYVKAVIVGDNVKEEDLRRYCSENLSKHKIPSVIEFRTSIPKNELGKIKREELTKVEEQSMENKPIRVGFIGCGWIVEHAHIPAFKKINGVKINSLFDIDIERASRLGEQYDIPCVYNNLSEFFSSCIDAVIVATPNNTHFQYSLQALQHGLHVICEKPIAVCSDEVKVLIDTATKVNKLYIPGFVNRFRYDMIKIRELIQSGKIGEVTSVEAGWLRRSGIPRPGTWFTNKALSGGGVLIDLGSHILDLCLMIIGDKQPLKQLLTVFGPNGKEEQFNAQWFVSNYSEELPIDVENTVVGRVEFERDTLLEVKLSWSSEINGDCTYFAIHGTRGSIKLKTLFGFSNDRLWDEDSMIVSDGKKGEEIIQLNKNINNTGLAFEAMARYFIDTVKEGNTNFLNENDGLRTVELTEKLYNSEKMVDMESKSIILEGLSLG